jgi:hypothetical protein
VAIGKLLASTEEYDGVILEEGGSCLPFSNLKSRARHAYTKRFGKGEVYNVSVSKMKIPSLKKRHFSKAK